MKTVFIVNPHAGTENNAAKLRSAIQALDEASCQLYATQGVGEATQFVERWTEEHPGEEVRFVRILTPYTNGQHLDNEKLKDIVVYRQARKVEVEAWRALPILWMAKYCMRIISLWKLRKRCWTLRFPNAEQFFTY